jgi:hypothetical protein
MPLGALIIAVELDISRFLDLVEILPTDAHHACKLSNDRVLHVFGTAIDGLLLASLLRLLRFLLHRYYIIAR